MPAARRDPYRKHVWHRDVHAVAPSVQAAASGFQTVDGRKVRVLDRGAGRAFSKLPHAGAEIGTPRGDELLGVSVDRAATRVLAVSRRRIYLLALARGGAGSGKYYSFTADRVATGVCAMGARGVFALACDDRSVLIYAREGREFVAALPCGVHSSAILRVEFEGSRLLVQSADALSCWDTVSGARIGDIATTAALGGEIAEVRFADASWVDRSAICADTTGAFYELTVAAADQGEAAGGVCLRARWRVPSAGSADPMAFSSFCDVGRGQLIAASEQDALGLHQIDFERVASSTEMAVQRLEADDPSASEPTTESLARSARKALETERRWRLSGEADAPSCRAPAVCFAPCNAVLFWLRLDGTVRMVVPSTGRQWQLQPPAHVLRLSVGGKSLAEEVMAATTDDGRLLLYRITDLMRDSVSEADDEEPTALAAPEAAAAAAAEPEYPREQRLPDDEGGGAGLESAELPAGSLRATINAIAEARKENDSTPSPLPLWALPCSDRFRSEIWRSLLMLPAASRALLRLRMQGEHPLFAREDGEAAVTSARSLRLRKCLSYVAHAWPAAAEVESLREIASAMVVTFEADAISALEATLMVLANYVKRDERSMLVSMDGMLERADPELCESLRGVGCGPQQWARGPMRTLLVNLLTPKEWRLMCDRVFAMPPMYFSFVVIGWACMFRGQLIALAARVAQARLKQAAQGGSARETEERARDLQACFTSRCASAKAAPLLDVADQLYRRCWTALRGRGLVYLGPDLGPQRMAALALAPGSGTYVDAFEVSAAAPAWGDEEDADREEETREGLAKARKAVVSVEEMSVDHMRRSIVHSTDAVFKPQSREFGTRR